MAAPFGEHGTENGEIWGFVPHLYLGGIYQNQKSTYWRQRDIVWKPPERWQKSL